MWLVNLENKDLEGYNGSVMSSLHGPHLVCLTSDQMILVQANCNGGADRSKGEAVEIPIASIRGIAHNKEGKFYIEPGRASGIGSGRLWMELGDEIIAASMHQTILRLMYDLKEEEAYNYRGRSFSSGSNSGRVRSLRSHHNNPPPSLVGMGKATGAHSLSKRLRCDSMPASRASCLNNSRLRTGSEGEHTLRRPSRHNSLRCHNGSTSPGMRSRLLKLPSRRSSFLHHPHHHPGLVVHKPVVSFSCSCNTSSNESSTEHLNNIVGYTDFSSLMAYDSAALEEFLNGNSTIQNGFHPGHRKSQNRPANHYQENCIFSVPEGRHCSCCSAHNSQLSVDDISRIPIRHEMAPPPPEIDPPHHPFISSSAAANDDANLSITPKPESVGESENFSSPPSSVSSRPSTPALQAAEFSDECNPSMENSERDCKRQSACISPLSSSPQSRSPPPPPNDTSPNVPDEYTPMNNNCSLYPHQIVPSSQQKVSNASFLSKVASFTGFSSHSRSSSFAGDQEYTPMAAPISDTKITSPPTTVEGYVPMKPFVKSIPQDIGSRRKSIPDTSYRQSRLHRSSPTLNDELATCQPFCQQCYDRARRQYMSQSPAASAVSPKSCLDSINNLQEDIEKSIGINSGHLAPPISDYPGISSSNFVSKEELLSLQQLHHEIVEVEKCSHPSNSNISISSNEIGGYLPMNSVNPVLNGHARKGLCNSPSASENHGQAGALYPHQRKDRTFSTNSLERPKQTRNKRAKSFSSLRGGSCRRTQSVRDKSANKHSFESGDASIFSPPQSSRSRGGDYVNIDFRKAQEHLNCCPHVVNVAAP